MGTNVRIQTAGKPVSIKIEGDGAPETIGLSANGNQAFNVPEGATLTISDAPSEADVKDGNSGNDDTPVDATNASKPRDDDGWNRSFDAAHKDGNDDAHKGTLEKLSDADKDNGGNPAGDAANKSTEQRKADSAKENVGKPNQIGGDKPSKDNEHKANPGAAR